MIRVDCDPLGDNPHSHEYPSDWSFGGPEGDDPRADPRFQSTHYYYLDGELEHVTVSAMPICDDEALDHFTYVAASSPNWSPMYVQAKRPGSEKLELLPWKYNPATDELEEW